MIHESIIWNSAEKCIPSTPNMRFATVYFHEETFQSSSLDLTEQIPQSNQNDEHTGLTDDDNSNWNSWLDSPRDELQCAPSLSTSSDLTELPVFPPASPVCDDYSYSQYELEGAADSVLAEHPHASLNSDFVPPSPSWSSWSDEKDRGSDSDELNLSGTDGGPFYTVDDPLGLSDDEKSLAADASCQLAETGTADFRS